MSLISELCTRGLDNVFLETSTQLSIVKVKHYLVWVSDISDLSLPSALLHLPLHYCTCLSTPALISMIALVTPLSMTRGGTALCLVWVRECP